MKEQPISFETAILAKEKGFNEETTASYFTPDNRKTYTTHYWNPGCNNSDYISDSRYSAPTQSLLQKWLRDKHNIIVDVISWKDHASDVNDPLEWKCFVNGIVVYIHFKSYEESLEEGLKEALKLIQ